MDSAAPTSRTTGRSRGGRRQLAEIARIERAISEIVYRLLLELGHLPRDVAERQIEDRRYRPIKRTRGGRVRMSARRMAQIHARHSGAEDVEFIDAIQARPRDLRDAIWLLSRGHTQIEIASMLHLTERSVKRLLSSVKTGLP